MMPPSASTSRTTVPLATPPMAGLHDIWPIVSSALVTSPVRAPRRAAATAASVPACPRADDEHVEVILERRDGDAVMGER